MFHAYGIEHIYEVNYPCLPLSYFCLTLHLQIKHPNNPEKVTGVLVLGMQNPYLAKNSSISLAKLEPLCPVGRVKLFHIRNDAITERGSIDLSRLLPVSRLGGVSYGRSTESYGKPKYRYPYHGHNWTEARWNVI